MSKIFSILLFVAAYHTGFAQETIRIAGKVVDHTTNEPLAFAHIGIFNTSYGTVANLNGEFTLLIPSKYAAEDLSASYLGYSLESLQVASIDQEQEVVFKLKSTATQLPDLVVTTKEQSIIEEAIAAIPRNHDQKEMQLRAFWRASIQDKEEIFVQMTEYAFDMFRTGLSGKEENAMKILRGRVARDTSFFADIGGMQIGVTPPTLFMSSLLKEHPILDRSVVKKHRYKITNVTTYKDRAVYVVSFSPKGKSSENRFEGEILLDTESLAFVKIAFTRLISSDKPKRVFGSLSMAALVAGLGKSTMDSYQNEMNYQLVDGKWYLSHAKYNIEWTMRRNEGDIVRPVTFVSDFVVTEIKKKQIILPPKEELASKQILERQVTKNTEEFWSDYNYLKADNNFEELFQEILERE
ncbi:MAG: carboxypeptidase-like regulatory domain-containing protein [Ekhidna sp.]|nr:carboxypeptidase-like regulatory domain-containing protein [Ekhidna sp.]